MCACCVSNALPLTAKMNNKAIFLAGLCLVGVVLSQDPPKPAPNKPQLKKEDVRLVAIPSNVVNGTTENLEVTCRPPTLDESIHFIVLLHLEKTGKDNASTPIASQRGQGTVLHVTDNRTSALGELTGEGGAFLTVKIASPAYNDTGVYQCRFAVLNMQTFDVTVLTRDINVTFTEPYQPTPQPALDELCSCDQVWAEVKSLRETLIAENRVLKSQLMAYDDTCRVSFSAQFADKTGKEFRSNGLALFNKVVSNKGNAYNPAKGIFSAPCAGQYFFQLSMLTHQQGDSGHVDGVIEVNGDAQARTSVFTDDVRDHYEQATNGAVLTLAKGDEVQVRIQTNSFGEFRGDVFTTFSGFFVNP